MLLDPSLLFLFFIAISCIIYGSHRSYSFYTSALVNNKETAEAIDSLKTKNVIIFPIAGSIVLILLFFFFGIIFYLLYIIVMIVSFASLFFVWGPAVDVLFERMNWTDKAIRLPRNKEVPANIVFLCLMCIVVILLWVVTGFWLIVDCIAWCIGITQISVIRLPNLRLAVILLGLFLLYDVFWVFISPYIFHGKSVMVTVATEMPSGALPLALTMPHFSGDDGYSLLGLGDIVLPGLFMSFVFSFDKSVARLAEGYSTVTPPKTRYFALVVLGYTVGFACTLLAFVFMKKGQPALLYLVPCTLAPVCIYAYYNNHIPLMWTGIPNNGQKVDIEQALVPVSASASSSGEEEGERLISPNENDLNRSNDDVPLADDVVVDAIKEAMEQGDEQPPPQQQ